MKISDLGPVIATRELRLSGKPGVSVLIGKPQPFPDGRDYYCPYRILGIGDEAVRYAGGVDAVQALELTLQSIGVRLYTSAEAEAGALSWEAGQGPGHLGFPVPESVKDLAPK